MQAENVKFFTGRLEALQRRWNCSDIELAKRLGISRQLIYLMRSGTQKPSKKSLRLLEIAERAAGIPGILSQSFIYQLQSALMKDTAGTQAAISADDARIAELKSGANPSHEEEAALDNFIRTHRAFHSMENPAAEFPTSGKEGPESFQRLENPAEKVPTPGQITPEDFQRLEKKMDEILNWIRKLEPKPKGKR